MADPKGFLTYRERELPARRPVDIRIRDWKEVYEDFPRERLQRQASRCMDCGIPFCHNGCPLGNLIPEWNDLVYRDEWREAAERLHATNNFPEFTGRLCPAPCEKACVLGINQPAVTIKQTEVSIIDRAFEEGWVVPEPPSVRTGRRVAVIGSGPAGLAAAQQLTRAGHEVVVYERADRIGGLLRYGIPEFKLEKRHLERRLGQMRAEGTTFVTGTEAGVDITAARLRADFDAIVLAGGATEANDFLARTPGRDLDGVHQAMEYLPPSNLVQEGDLAVSPIDAAGKHVVIIGGGDTGADCVGTAVRQGAASVTQLEIMPKPPSERPDSQPWPTYPMLFKRESAHEELPNGDDDRVYGVNTVGFVGTGRVRALRLVDVRGPEERFAPIEGTEREIPADLVLFALGFSGPEKGPLLADLADEAAGDFFDGRNVGRDRDYMTALPGVFAAGDLGRGQSLIVWAIAEGRAAAAGVDQWLTGRTSLPAPIPPTARALT